jgi:hypothetical protein
MAVYRLTREKREREREREREGRGRDTGRTEGEGETRVDHTPIQRAISFRSPPLAFLLYILCLEKSIIKGRTMP